jgi:hypothetical protein
MLKARGLDYEFEANVAIEDIREAEEAQVRLEIHRAPKEQVTKYATAMSHGATLPAVVLNEHYEKIDGNTRLEAKRRLKHDTIPAYIVYGVTPVEARSLSVELNQSNGQAMTDGEIRKFIVDAMREGQELQVPALAKITGARDLKIKRWIAEARFEERANRHALDYQVLPPSTKAVLNSVKLDAVFIAMTKLATAARLPTAEVKRLVSAVNHAGSEQDALDVVNSEHQTRAEEIRAIASGFSGARKSKGSVQHLGGLLHFSAEDLLDVAEDKQYETYLRMTELRELLSSVINRATQEWKLTPPAPTSEGSDNTSDQGNLAVAV